MSRWEPHARARLQQASLELYHEHGFEQTTVSEIAKQAGLTERTFFRYFADKREVLFWGSGDLQELLVGTLASSPDSLAAMDAVGVALGASSALFADRRDYARVRQEVIAANADLQERELMKLASLSVALADTLRRRGVRDPAARLAADAGVAVFVAAFQSWLDDPDARDLTHHIEACLGELRAVTAGA